MKYNFNGITSTEIKKELDRIESLQMKAITPIRTPICITFDLSGSMAGYVEKEIEILDLMFKELSLVPKRIFTLLVVVIHHSEPKIVYFGDLLSLDFESFKKDFPKRALGRTPLAKSLEAADEILTTVADVCERNNQWYTIPVFFSVTDSAATDSADDCSVITEKFKKDIADGNKLLSEFVTNSNPNGLNFGGYRVKIDEENSSKRIKSFMQALRFATSTQAESNGVFLKGIPHRSTERKQYNRYKSDEMLNNFKYSFGRN